MKTDCLGCRLANEQLPIHKIYEDAYVTAFLDHDPFNEGHALILPKTHYRFIDEFDEATADAVMKAARLLTKAIKELYQPDGITFCQNGGAFDDLTHFHLHVVPRKEDQPFASFYTDEPWDNEELKEQLPETRTKLVQAIQYLLKEQ